MSSPATDIHGEQTGLVARLSLEEKVRLLTGADGWVLHGAKAAGLRPIVLSEYGITAVRRSIALNRVFRAKGWLTIKDELGRELLDCGASKVFAIADHQIAIAHALKSLL